MGQTKVSVSDILHEVRDPDLEGSPHNIFTAWVFVVFFPPSPSCLCFLPNLPIHSFHSAVSHDALPLLLAWRDREQSLEGLKRLLEELAMGGL